ncbi:helix-turn-helix domain-containing protein [Nocardioidaceae bacterium]|nr:helix-turn-helix domain-containing protein [Nocardioidaceae bacterium]
MNTEQNAELTRRAAVHAALGDPARLRIVDTLLIGDASPSELSRVLGMPSNLLAHHLGTLESSGLVSRRRSEGDGRRTYLRLARDVLSRTAPAASDTPDRVVFVCTANSARSHLAAALWKQTSDIPTASAGTHPAATVDRGAVEAARRHHLPMPRIQPRSLTDVLVDGDLVVTVCDRAHETLGEVSAVHWSVADPVGASTTEAFDVAVEDLSVRVGELARRVSTPV